MSKLGTILVVDDTPINLTMLVNMLTKQGYTVDSAHTGPQALEVIQQRIPDLILLDVMMPDMDGYEVCQRLKQDPVTADIPIIFISAMNDVDGIVKAFEVGGVDYVTKPFQLREVAKRVETHLQLVRQRREIQALREQEHQQFEKINAMREKFIYAATHDLKNPLQLISGYVEVMRGTSVVENDDDINFYLDGVVQGVRKIMGLVGDMLDLIQMESSIDPSPEPTDLNRFLKDDIDQFAIAAQQKDITLHLDVPDEPIIANVDPRRMLQVMDNLISNGIKYTQEGGSVTVSLYGADTGHVFIEVTDTGLISCISRMGGRYWAVSLPPGPSTTTACCQSLSSKLSVCQP